MQLKAMFCTKSARITRVRRLDCVVNTLTKKEAMPEELDGLMYAIVFDLVLVLEVSRIRMHAT